MARTTWFTDEARWLMTAGACAAARMHGRGMPIDIDYCRAAQKELWDKMEVIQEEAWKGEGGKEWRKRYGDEASLSNDNQLRPIVCDVLKLQLPADALTKGGKVSMKADVLEDLDHPLIDQVLEYRKFEKAAGTFLTGLIREEVDGKIHPFFHVCGFEGGENTVVTYRTSSSDPNFQNQPIRDPVIGKIIRSSFRAPPGWCFVEVDYSGIEVHAAAWYHKDPTMLEFLRTGHDMHKDFTRDCFILTEEDYANVLPKPKEARNVVKNQFTFAEFYGSYWPSVAAGLWKMMRRRKLLLKGGRTFEAHLACKGITGLGAPKYDARGRMGSPARGTFCKHIQEVEDALWNKYFPKYAQWRKDWVADYRRTGGFSTLTGFRHEGAFRRNEVINTPIQGTACHCKLRGLIGLTDTVCKRKIRGFPNAEIHDSLISLVPEEEVQDYLGICHDEMVTKVKKAWPFIITPISIEADVSPAGGTWYEKAAVKIA